jgi:hypothetical protein
MGNSASSGRDAHGSEGGRRMSSRSHALCNPLSTNKRAARDQAGEGLLPDALLLHVASFSVAPHQMDWRTLLALRAVNSSISAVLVCEDAAPVLWRRLLRPPTDGALALGARGAGRRGPTHVDLSGCAALTDAALAALRGGSHLRVLNVSGHFYGGSSMGLAEDFVPPDAPFTPKAVEVLLASLVSPAGQASNIPLHLITNDNQRWRATQGAADAKAEMHRVQLGMLCQGCDIDMLEERGGHWAPCDMCSKHVCGEYGERSTECIPMHHCTRCNGIFCAECDTRHSPNSGWGHHSCDGCSLTVCRSCAFWPECDECHAQKCLQCDDGDFLVCDACNTMWCEPCADGKGVTYCDMCEKFACEACGCLCVY